MKFSITISDLTPEEYQEMNARIGMSVPAEIIPDPIEREPVKDTTAVVTDRFPDPALPGPSTSSDAPRTDVDGVPWDERIHASSKHINNDGRWKARRGVAKDARDAVMAELMGQTSIPDTVMPDTGAAVVNPTGHEGIPANTGPITNPTGFTQETVAPSVTFDDVMTKMNQVIVDQNNPFTSDHIGVMCQKLGATIITDIATDADKCAQAMRILSGEEPL